MAFNLARKDDEKIEGLILLFVTIKSIQYKVIVSLVSDAFAGGPAPGVLVPKETAVGGPLAFVE